MEVNLVFFPMSRKAAKESASSHHVHGLAQFPPFAESSDQYPGQGDTAALSLAIPSANTCCDVMRGERHIYNPRPPLVSQPFIHLI